MGSGVGIQGLFWVSLAAVPKLGGVLKQSPSCGRAYARGRAVDVLQGGRVCCCQVVASMLVFLAEGPGQQFLPSVFEVRIKVPAFAVVTDPFSVEVEVVNTTTTTFYLDTILLEFERGLQTTGRPERVFLFDLDEEQIRPGGLDVGDFDRCHALTLEPGHSYIFLYPANELSLHECLLFDSRPYVVKVVTSYRDAADVQRTPVVATTTVRPRGTPLATLAGAGLGVILGVSLMGLRARGFWRWLRSFVRESLVGFAAVLALVLLVRYAEAFGPSPPSVPVNDFIECAVVGFFYKPVVSLLRHIARMRFLEVVH